MDSIEVTLRRTAAATAVAARHLARADSRTATICGCGIQARAQLQALRRVLPIAQVFAFDMDAAAARVFSEEASELGLAVTPAESLPSALAASDVCVTCTPSRRALLFPEHVRPGTFVAAVGADSADKQELDPRLLAAAVVVADVLEQCAVIGDLHHALAAGTMSRADVHAELADVIVGRKAGRRTAAEVTVFDSTGTALQDVAAAAIVYEKAVAAGVGLCVALGE